MRSIARGALVVSVLAGCGGASHSPDADGATVNMVDGGAGAAGDGAGLSGGGGTAGAQGSACNSVQNGAPLVASVAAPGGATSPPPAMGGTIVAGTYRLTSSTFYPAPSCGFVAPTAATLVAIPSSVTSGTFEIAFGTGATSAFTETIAYSTTGTSLTAVLTCFNPGLVTAGTSTTGPYTANETVFMNYLLDSSCGPHVDVYTRQ